MQYHPNGFVPGDPDIAPAEPARAVGENGFPSHVDVIIAGCGPAGLCLPRNWHATPIFRP